MSSAGVLSKVKRPSGTHTYCYVASDVDAFGRWLHLPRGAAWTAPHASGTLPFDVLVLLAPQRPTVTWWCDDPEDRRIEVDVCLPPVEVENGWQFVDLELDVERHGAGPPVIRDEDEFAEARRAGHIDRTTAALAETACADVIARLGAREEPFGNLGWSRLTGWTSHR